MDEVQGADEIAPQGTPTGAPLDVAPGTERAPRTALRGAAF